MDKFLRPDRFDTSSDSPTAAKEWVHWKRTFSNFLNSADQQGHTPDKLNMLINFVSPSVYEYISECSTFDAAMTVLETVYVRPKNEVLARHLLATRRQQPGEPLDQYLQELRHLSKDCNFKAVTAEAYKEECIRDAFINGLSSPVIRQRLLENKTLDLKTMFDQARSLESAQQSNQLYSQTLPNVVAAVSQNSDSRTISLETESIPIVDEKVTSAASLRSNNRHKCFFCGNNSHPRRVCPARDAVCHNCKKTGHFSSVCRATKSRTSGTFASCMPILASVTVASPACLSKAVIDVMINGLACKALMDTGSSESFLNRELARTLSIPVSPSKGGHVKMASSTLTSPVVGTCLVNLSMENDTYNNIQLPVLENLCCDIILGHDFMNKHESICINFGGSGPAMSISNLNSVCGLASSTIEPPELFTNLTKDCRPIATKSRRYSMADKDFIKTEITRLLAEGIIEPSLSPWRAQVLVTSNENHKKRLVIDYSQTINKYTELDAYPFPNINEMVSEIAKYKIYSTLNLRSAYHQISLREHEKKYTAFEACGQLYHFCRVPFRVTNGVACFQRVMDQLVSEHDLKSVFVCLDNITVCGMNQKQHDENLHKFLDVAQKHQLILNENKCVYSVETVDLLGYSISQRSLKPDSDRMKPLKELPVPYSCYSYDIKYRPCPDNVSADCFPRAYCSTVSSDALMELHAALCHPGISRLAHFVRAKNLPYSVDDVKRVVRQCQVCARVKPQYTVLKTPPLIKATQPFERLSIDFKGPLTSATRHKYLLTVVDEYSRFPFAFPCADMTSRTVIQCLGQLFALFGMPAYIHSDRGQSFMSSELKTFLHGHGVASSRTCAYNPQGNGQCERYNGIIWKAITLALHSKGLKDTEWEMILPDALHSIRSLLCTSTNCTPHERFFTFQRRSSTGQSIPSWLTHPGPVLMKRHIRNSKYDSMVDEVDLIEANNSYAHVRLQDGRETTVSLKHLAPAGSPDNTTDSSMTGTDNSSGTTDVAPRVEESSKESEILDCEIPTADLPVDSSDIDSNISRWVRRSTRVTKKPERLVIHN